MKWAGFPLFLPQFKSCFYKLISFVLSEFMFVLLKILFQDDTKELKISRNSLNSWLFKPLLSLFPLRWNNLCHIETIVMILSDRNVDCPSEGSFGIKVLLAWRPFLAAHGRLLLRFCKSSSADKVHFTEIKPSNLGLRSLGSHRLLEHTGSTHLRKGKWLKRVWGANCKRQQHKPFHIYP